MKKLLFVFFVTYLVGCATTSNQVEKPEVTEIADQKEHISADAAPLKEKLKDLAVSSDCARTAHDEQGTPPKSYMRGIALSFARAVCDHDGFVNQVGSQPVGDASRDFMAHYGLSPATPEARLETTFALLLGSAARESSWRWCVGKDPGASNTTAETCEAGLYQTSYNSRSSHPALPALIEQAKTDKSGCFAQEYKGATQCSESNLKNWGSGEGVVFQQLSKDCPGFASEYHAIMVRVRRTHYGPINAKRSLVKPACVSLFSQLRGFVAANPAICQALK